MSAKWYTANQYDRRTRTPHAPTETHAPTTFEEIKNPPTLGGRTGMYH